MSLCGSHSVVQFLFSSLGVKVPTIVKEARKAIADGYCVVVGLQTTGEASLDSEVSKGETLNDFVSTAREMLFRFIMQNFPTKNIPVVSYVDQNDEV